VINKSGKTPVAITPIDLHLLRSYFATLFKESDHSANNDLLADKITNTDLDKPINCEEIINMLNNLNRGVGSMGAWAPINISDLISLSLNY